MVLSSGFIDITPDTQEGWYDIKLQNGSIVMDCWFNNGAFRSLVTGHSFKVESVYQIKEIIDPATREIAQDGKENECSS